MNFYFVNFLFCESLIVVYVDFHPLCCELIRFFYAKNNQNLEILEYIFKKMSTNNENNENYKVKVTEYKVKSNTCGQIFD